MIDDRPLGFVEPDGRLVGRQVEVFLLDPASGRSGVDEIATTEEKVTEALQQLQKLDSIKKVADGIEKGAAKIDRECEAMNVANRRLLGQALAALAGSEAVAQ